MIYLDNSATTKPFPEVLETYKSVAGSYFANPSSIHGKGGEAERLLAKARLLSSGLLHVDQDEVVFTSGGSEGNNLALKGVAFGYRSRGKHIVTTKMEHPSVMEACEQLEHLGYEVTYLPVHEDGRVSLEDLRAAIRPGTILVSVIHVNNELGTIQPVEQIGQYLRQFPTIQFHVDHVQGAAKVPLDIKKAGIDICTLSGHKFHGPRGIGVLYVRQGIQLMPLFSGGGQENGFRAGTENVPAIVGMTKALRMSLDQEKEGVPHMKGLLNQLRSALKEMDGVTVHTPEKHAAPHILNASVEGVKPEILIHALEEKGVYISTRSACSSKESGASRVLLAMGLSKKLAETSVRISLSLSNTKKEINETITALQETIPALREGRSAH